MATAEDDQQPLIAVIDDDSALVRMIGLELESAGYRVQTAGTAADGLALMDGDPPALVLLDLHLQDVDGITVLKQIRDIPKKRPEWQVPPVIIMTNAYEVTIINQAMELGVHDYVLKADMQLAEIVKLVASYVPTGQKPQL